MKNSAIQWTHHTLNPWLGCRRVAPECDKCYIVRQTPLRVRHIEHGLERYRCSESTRNQPLAWDRAAAKAAERHRVFSLSLGDWADGEVPNEWRDELFDIIERTPNLDYLLLTKRPALGARYLMLRYPTGIPRNIWLGVSAGVDAKPLLDIPATLHFLSCEPMLRPLALRQASLFKWIIFGGESEPGGEPRSTALEWIQDGLDFCRANGITPFVKQLGGRPTSSGMPYTVSNAHGDKMEEWPEALRVREIPETTICPHVARNSARSSTHASAIAG